MKKLTNALLISIFLIANFACNRVLVPQESVRTSTIKIDSSYQSNNPFLDSMIGTYSKDMGDLLERKLIVSEDQLQKKRPESALGNYMADAVLWSAKKYNSDSVDFAFVNMGGIRNS